MLRIYLVLGNIVRGGTAIHPARSRRLQTYTDFRVRERQMDDGSYGWIGDPDTSPGWFTIDEDPEIEKAIEEGAWRDWAPGFVEGPVDWGVRRVGGPTLDVVLPATNVYVAVPPTLSPVPRRPSPPE